MKKVFQSTTFWYILFAVVAAIIDIATTGVSLLSLPVWLLIIKSIFNRLKIADLEALLSELGITGETGSTTGPNTEHSEPVQAGQTQGDQ